MALLAACQSEGTPLPGPRAASDGGVPRDREIEPSLDGGSPPASPDAARPEACLLVPPALSFVAAVEAEARATIEIVNRCREPVVLHGGRIARGAEYFTLDRRVAAQALPGGGVLTLTLTHRPPAAIAVEGLFELDTGDLGQPLYRVALHGRGLTSGLAVFPRAIDLGLAVIAPPGATCATAEGRVHLFATGETSEIIDAVELTTDSDPGFALSGIDGEPIGDQSFPRAIPPGSEATVTVRFVGSDASPPFPRGTLTLRHRDRTTRIDLAAERIAPGPLTQALVRSDATSFDALWILDPSTTMRAKLEHLLAEIGTLFGVIDPTGAAYTWAVTESTLRGDLTGNLARCLDDRFVTRTSADRVGLLRCLLTIPLRPEPSLSAASAAMAALLEAFDDRQAVPWISRERTLSLILISDHDELQDRDLVLSGLLQELREEATRGVTVHAIVGPEATKYLTLSLESEGLWIDARTKAWGAAITDLARALTSPPPRLRLRGVPRAGSVALRIDGVDTSSAAAGAALDRTTRWLSLEPVVLPPGHRLDVSYEPSCLD
ncbi:MAG: hypothetical protein IT384_31835 [Deltaproteobacteria bacterium]|nr:hypothetical protein [Deltaproteobacteria bacterium]